MKLIALMLTCGMGMPIERCNDNTALMIAPRKVDAWTCARDGLHGQSAAQIGNSGTYDKLICKYVPKWRPGYAGR